MKRIKVVGKRVKSGGVAIHPKNRPNYAELATHSIASTEDSSLEAAAAAASSNSLGVVPYLKDLCWHRVAA